MSEPEEPHAPGEHPEDCEYCQRMARVNVEEDGSGSGSEDDPFVIRVD